MSKREPRGRSTVAAIVLGALCVNTDGVRVVHISATEGASAEEKIAKELQNRRTVALPDPDARRSWQQSGMLARH